jgi:hypothetical protein
MAAGAIPPVQVATKDARLPPAGIGDRKQDATTGEALVRLVHPVARGTRRLDCR